MPTPSPIIAAMVAPADGMSIRWPVRPITASEMPTPTTATASGTAAAIGLRNPRYRTAKAATSPMISLRRVDFLSAAAARLPPGVTSIPAAAAGSAASTRSWAMSAVMSRPATSSSTDR